MAVQIKKDTALTSLSITPMIDIVFLLLIFFLVATRFAEEDRELDVDLPTASEAQPSIAKPLEIVINIDREGRFFLDNRQMSIDEVEKHVHDAVTNNPLSQSAIIRADRQTDWDHVVAVMNACRRAGVRDINPITASD